MEREELLRDVGDLLGRRRLIWAGLRADDAASLADLPNFAASFSLIAPSALPEGITSLGLDELTGRRVDPETWDVDDHLTDRPVARFRAAISEALRAQSALMPYRSSRFLSAIHLARHDSASILGLFSGQQSLFEHKPWIEQAITRLDVPRIPWRYVADEDRHELRNLPEGEYVLRPSRTSGGEGIVRALSATDIPERWPHTEDGVVAVAPYILGVPMNVGATVWRDGVTVHHPSVQLIGIPACVGREFGYCGNDFAAASHLGDGVINEIESTTIKIGNWLRGQGYLGSLGIDFLLTEDGLLFTEINPRFQGSSPASARLDREAGLPCLLIEHLGAWLGMCQPKSPRLRDRVALIEPRSNLVVHWTGREPRHVDGRALVERVAGVEPDSEADVVVSPHVVSDPGSTVARFSVPRSVTRTGFDVSARLVRVIDEWRSEQFRGVTRGGVVDAVPAHT